MREAALRCGRSATLFLITASALLVACGGPDELTRTSENAIGGRRGVDYAWARPSPQSLAASGFSFAARYLSYDTTGKNLSGGEARALAGAGVDVLVVWEQNASEALAGFGRGASDASAAQREADGDGMPAGRPIYFAIDFDASPGQQGAIDSYFDGVASVLGRNRTGAYGGYWPIRRLFDGRKIAFAWQTLRERLRTLSAEAAHGCGGASHACAGLSALSSQCTDDPP